MLWSSRATAIELFVVPKSTAAQFFHSPTDRVYSLDPGRSLGRTCFPAGHALTGDDLSLSSRLLCPKSDRVAQTLRWRDAVLPAPTRFSPHQVGGARLKV